MASARSRYLASIKAKGRKMYAGLRKRGWSKSRAAATANAYSGGTWGCFFGRCGKKKKG